ncbi:tyrosine-type recombinase/integrase [uncultured Draconibacterium sp.]|uniref:tyrosine-type recombinase/integrase n=1 Tax=uncultured Draconibacterium sp. TaxID=1573823 RepID=UPI0029C94FF4|nr:tyrosine-type recombinase/integrase [uncultured Draconibacterium sp.]
MDIKKLKKTHPELLEYMKANGFGSGAIGGVKVMFRRLFDHEGKYTSYNDFYKKFISREGLEGSTKRLRYYRTSVRTIQGFDEFDHFPNRLKFAPVQYRECSYEHLNPTFKGIVDHYMQVASKECKSEKSIRVESNAGAAFLCHMQRNGAIDLCGITESMVLSFFYDGYKQLRGCSYRTKIKTVLKSAMGTDYYAQCARIIDDMPRLRNGRKNFATLKDDEIRIIKENLQEGARNDFSLRDKAVVSMAMYTALRGTDIARMRINNIDLERDLIILTQSKTQQPMILPLRAIVGNPLVDYLSNERPRNLDIKSIFTNVHDPENPMDSSTIGGIIRRFFAKLGIRSDDKENGLRLFRRYLASKVLENGVQPRVISDILGHLSSESLNPYIDTDIKHLRECGVSIEQYPVGKEVFEV